MSTTIQMGNDEFILFIRKNYPECTKNNVRLGKLIWEWIAKNDATAEQVDNGESKDCFWGLDAANIAEDKLPKTAAQFRFDRSLLPELYSLLGSLGSE